MMNERQVEKEKLRQLVREMAAMLPGMRRLNVEPRDEASRSAESDSLDIENPDIESQDLYCPYAIREDASLENLTARIIDGRCRRSHGLTLDQQVEIIAESHSLPVKGIETSEYFWREHKLVVRKEWEETLLRG